MKEILGNGLETIVSQALQKMKEEQGESFRIETVNLAALQRMTAFREPVSGDGEKSSFARTMFPKEKVYSE